MIIQSRILEGSKFKGRDCAFISFNFDVDVLGRIKEIVNRFYHVNEKLWEIPLGFEYENFKAWAKENDLIFKEENLLKKRVSAIPKDYKFKIEPMAHQKAGIEFGLKVNNFLLADEMGLGKTMQALHIAAIERRTRGFKHCLVICGVNDSKFTWLAEVEKHTYETGRVLGYRFNKGHFKEFNGVKGRIEDLAACIGYSEYFLITNMESLRSEAFVKELQKQIAAGNIGKIIFDEIHRCKNPTSQQGRGLLKIQAQSHLPMTGTPMMNYPIDLYMPMKWCGYETNNLWMFKQRYCVFGMFNNIVGFKNLGELRTRIQEMQLRRKAKECLDLPDKIYRFELLEMEKAQQKIYDEVYTETLAQIDKIKELSNPLVALLRLRQATVYTGILSTNVKESVKFQRCFDLVEEAIANGRKVIIFGNYKEAVKPLYKAMAKEFGCVCITGDNKAVEVDALKKQFQNDNACKVLLATIDKMGTAHTLTAGSVVIFLDEPWNMAVKEQAEDRAYRIGTEKDVIIITLICQGTVDEKINQLLDKKKEYFDLLVEGNKGQFKNRSALVDFLLK